MPQTVCTLQQAVDRLLRFIESCQSQGRSPIAWVGAGASVDAGFPTLGQIERRLREELGPVPQRGFALIESYVKRVGEESLLRQFDPLSATLVGAGEIHQALTRLAQSAGFAAIFTTNFDQQIELALQEEAIPFATDVLGADYQLPSGPPLRLLRLYRPSSDNQQILRNITSEPLFESGRSLLYNQLEKTLGQHPLLFVGCSLQDPRLIRWLEELSPKARSLLCGGRALMAERDWNQIPAPVQSLIQSCNIQPILLQDRYALAVVLSDARRSLSPPNPTELVFTIRLGEEHWVIEGPVPECPSHKVPNPFTDQTLVEQLALLADKARQPVPVDSPHIGMQEGALDSRAHAVGARLTLVLLSNRARQIVADRLQDAVAQGRARLLLRIDGAPNEVARAAALPWELLMPEAGEFAVLQHKLDLVRQQAGAHPAPRLPPQEAPTILLSATYPASRNPLRFEEDTYRLYRAAFRPGFRVRLVPSGDWASLLEEIKTFRPTVLHLSAPILGNQLVFEDEQGLNQALSIEQLVERLRDPSREEPSLPPVLFLCAGPNHWPASSSSQPPTSGGEEFSSRTPRSLEAFFDRGASIGAMLHQLGFAHVVVYFGPSTDALAARAAYALFRALGQGKTLVQALRKVRWALSDTLETPTGKVRYPLAWTQVALYSRQPNLSFAPASHPAEQPSPAEEPLQLPGLAYLPWGLVGRRSARQLFARKTQRESQRFLVIEGPAGVGKTALASHLLLQQLTQEPSDRLLIHCAYLNPNRFDWASSILDQVQAHGHKHRLTGWSSWLGSLYNQGLSWVENFERSVEQLREMRPGLVLYVDGVDALLREGVAEAGRAEVRSWHPAAWPFCQALERLSERGLVLLSSRFGWPELQPQARLPLWPLSRIDLIRLMQLYPALNQLPPKARLALTDRLDGLPLTLSWLSALLQISPTLVRPESDTPEAWLRALLPTHGQGSGLISGQWLLQQLWAQMSGPCRTQARLVSQLRKDTPWGVLEHLGPEVQTLADLGLIVGCEGQASSTREHRRWAMPRQVVDFVLSRVPGTGAQAEHGHLAQAFARYLSQGQGSTAEQLEAFYHFHLSGAQDPSWPLYNQYASWLRAIARLQERRPL